MKKADIEKLLSIRVAWDRYKAAGEKSKADIDGYYGVVWAYGIERRDEIAALNDALTLQWIRENMAIHGECDECSGYKGTPPCVTAYGDKACYLECERQRTRIKVEIDKKMRAMGDHHYLGILMGIRAGVRAPAKADVYNVSTGKTVPNNLLQGITITGDRISFLCPAGHGYYHDYVTPVEKAPFDLYWVP